ncbi:protein of unknown function [Rhodovastum atsumiense]|nr:protein of unknown function [Rhodovastum atsumiense]
MGSNPAGDTNHQVQVRHAVLPGPRRGMQPQVTGSRVSGASLFHAATKQSQSRKGII